MTPVLPHLDFDHIGRTGKPLIGYSDMTSLVNLVPRRSGLVAFHGPMVISEWGEFDGPWEPTAAEFDQVLGREHTWTHRAIGAAAHWSDENLFWDREDVRRRQGNSGDQQTRTLRPGEAAGPLWGGSLIVLGLLLGTDLWPEPEPGSIVFLEADGMPPDELWARLEQFRLAGVFDRAGGVIMGKVGNPQGTPSGYTGYGDVLRASVPEPLPVAAGFDIGHADPMCTLPVGGRTRLDCPQEGTPQLHLLRSPQDLPPHGPWPGDPRVAQCC